MPLDRPDNQLTFHRLYDSPVAGIQDYRCKACRSGPAKEEYAEENSIVLMRHGAFSKHFGSRSLTADVNQTVFFRKGTSYRVSHPGDCGDRGTVISLSQQLLNDIIAEFDPSIGDHPEQPFPFTLGPCEPEAYKQHRDLVRMLESAIEPPDPILVDEMILNLTASALEAAFARMGVQRRAGVRRGTAATHADRAEAVKAHLAAHLGERIALKDVSLAVFASPFHLARLFYRHTGVSLHRYLILLRLRASLERLADGENDITSLALDLGFSSHSHFTGAFRREFGFAPSQARRNAGGRRLREMSKNLEV